MAPGFSPAARRKKGAYPRYVTLFATQRAGEKNKPDGAAIFERCPRSCAMLLETKMNLTAADKVLTSTQVTETDQSQLDRCSTETAPPEPAPPRGLRALKASVSGRVSAAILPLAMRLARDFVGGETSDDALLVAKRLAKENIPSTLGFWDTTDYTWRQVALNPSRDCDSPGCKRSRLLYLGEAAGFGIRSSVGRGTRRRSQSLQYPPAFRLAWARDRGAFAQDVASHAA